MSTLFNDEVAEDNSSKAISIMMFRGHTDTISCNLLAARAITSRHITTGQIIAKDFRTAAGVATGGAGSPGGLWFNSTAIRGLSGGTGAYGSGGSGDIGVSGSQIEFEIRAATGKAYFAGGKIVLDCNGISVYSTVTSGITVVRMDTDFGIKINANQYPISFNTDVDTNSSVGHIQTDLAATGSTTYGGHSGSRLVTFSDKLDIVLNASSQDIGLFPDPTHVYIIMKPRLKVNTELNPLCIIIYDSSI